MKKIHGNRAAYNYLKELHGNFITFGTFNSYVSLKVIPHIRQDGVNAFNADDLLEWAKTRRSVKAIQAEPIHAKSA